MSTLTTNLKLIEVASGDLVNSGAALNSNMVELDTFLTGQQILNVQAPVYGATGNGVTDDTAAIQAALNAAGALASSTEGVIVVIPPGSYLITASVRLNVKTGVTIWAYGAYIFKGGTPSIGILCNFLLTDSFAAYGGNSQINIYGGIWDGKSQNAAVDAGYDTVDFNHCSGIRVQDATFRNTCSDHALELNSTDGAFVINCRFEGFRDATHDLSRQFSEAIQIDGSWSSASASIPLYDGTPTKNVLVQGCYQGPAVDGSGNGPHGKLVGSHSAGSGGQYTNMQVIGCRINTTLDVGIAAFNWSQVVIADNIILSPGNYGIRSNAPDPASFGFNSIPQDVVIQGNIVENAGTVTSSAGISVLGVTSSAYVSDVVVADNIIRGATGQGILIESVNRLQVSGNHVYGSSSNCINIQGATAPLIANNWLYHPGSNYCIFLGVDSGSSINTTDGNVEGNVCFLGTGATAGIKIQTGTTTCLVHGNTIRKDGGSSTIAVSCSAGAGTTNTVDSNDLTGFGDATATITVSSGTINKTFPTTTNIGRNLG